MTKYNDKQLSIIILKCIINHYGLIVIDNSITLYHIDL